MSSIRHVFIRGRVQGVGYRAWLQSQARTLHVVGWVRNRRDGAVEALLSGPETVLSRLLELCADGPRFAEVREVEAASLEEIPSSLEPLRSDSRVEAFSILSTL